MKCLFNNLQWA